MFLKYALLLTLDHGPDHDPDHGQGHDRTEQKAALKVTKKGGKGDYIKSNILRMASFYKLKIRIALKQENNFKTFFDFFCHYLDYLQARTIFTC